MGLIDWIKGRGVAATVQPPAYPMPEPPLAPLVFPVGTAPYLVKQSWPLQSSAMTVYGDPRTPGWLAANTVRITPPWKLDPVKSYGETSIVIHKKCAASLNRVLAYIWAHADRDQARIESLHYDRFSGSFNIRSIRGDPAHMSMHSFAVALDWDDDNNQQHSQTHEFTDDSLIVQAFELEGWIWGGRWSPGSIDAMHFQAARVH